MAVSIDWGTYVISVQKSDMTLVQSVPFEIYNLDLNWFRLQLKDLEDDAEGMIFPDTHSHNTEVTVGGLTLARVIEILDPYTITFENGQYAVNLIGANSNVGDRVNVNQVSVRSQNSAGLVTSTAIEYGEYGGSVHVDPIGGVSGTIYPTGTPRQPVNNLTDAALIAASRGFKELHILDDLTVGAGDVFNNFVFQGSAADYPVITFEDAADITSCEVRNVVVAGYLDGGSILRECIIGDLNYVNGVVFQCMLNPGTITLGGGPGATAHFLECYSGVPGTGTPQIDMNGDDAGLGIRGYNGGIEIVNKTGSSAVSIDLNSGQCKLRSSCTNGQIVVRGVGYLIDETAGATVVTDGLINRATIATAVDSSLATKLQRNKAVISSDELTVTIYDDDGVTPLQVFDISADKKTRTPQ